MTHEEMTQFVNENINLVPNVMKSRFEKMDIEKQYTRMLHYVEMQKMKEEAQSLTRIAARVKQLFEAKHATIEDANSVITYCQSYIETCKEQELQRIDNEIQRLTELKTQLETKK